MPFAAERFDRYDNLFHTPNVTLEVETQVCVESQKEYYITKTAGALYDCEAACPAWEQFVMRCIEGDIALYRYLQKAAGYSILSGDISEQEVFCLHSKLRRNTYTYSESVYRFLFTNALR